MLDPRFYPNVKPFSFREIAQIPGVQLPDSLPQEVFFDHVSPLDKATASGVSLFHNMAYLDQLTSTQAGAVILKETFKDRLPPHVVPIVAEDPYRVFGYLLENLFQEVASPAQVHPTAVVSPSAHIGNNVSVGPYTVIHDNVVLEGDVTIGSHVVLQRGVVVKEGTYIGDGCWLSHCYIGKKVHLEPYVCVGKTGFGFHRDYRHGHQRIPQLGRVMIEDNVWVGTHTVIDRGSLEDTIIGAGSMIDNLVQIAHNVQTGKNCVIVAQVGIAGSTVLGDAVTLAGQAGIAGHLTLGAGVVVAAQSGVMRDVSSGEVVGGSPAVPIQQWRRQSVLLKKLAQKPFKETK